LVCRFSQGWPDQWLPSQADEFSPFSDFEDSESKDRRAGFGPARYCFGFRFTSKLSGDAGELLPFDFIRGGSFFFRHSFYFPGF